MSGHAELDQVTPSPTAGVEGVTQKERRKEMPRSAQGNGAGRVPS